MTFSVIISDDVEKTLSKLKRKDKKTFKAFQRKILQIASSDKTTIQHFKNLRKPLQDFKRVHIKSYVLLFRIDNDTILIEAFNHHDNIYNINKKGVHNEL